jgi:2-methylcitrate dehydratase PrpD
VAELLHQETAWAEPAEAVPSADLPLARRLAEAVLAPRIFPTEVVAKAKTCLIDFLSCAFEARDLPWSQQACNAALKQPGGATIIGTSLRAMAPDAVFANAVLGHGLVREDMHTGSVAHLGVVVWPTVLVLAETRPIRGTELLAAAIAGYEIGGRVGRRLMTADLARLFRPTGLVGPLAAAAAGARLSGLDAVATANALAFAVNAAGGLNQWPHTGSDDMYFHPGFAARDAMTCVALAAAGAQGSPAIFEGEAGMFAAFARKPLEGGIELFPSGETEISAVFNKPVPACNYAQTPCQVALAITREAQLDSRRIHHIEVRVSDAAVRYPGCDGRGPFRRALQAKMSIAFGVAATFARGEIAEENYRRLNDPEIERLVAATTLAADPHFTSSYPARQGATVRVTLDDGSVVERSMEDVVFATAAFVRLRFRAAASEALGADGAARIEAAVDDLEASEDAGEVIRLCTAGTLGAGR